MDIEKKKLAFEIEYGLEQFREVQSDYFNSEGKVYKTAFQFSTQPESMLELINNLEAGYTDLAEENKELRAWKESAMSVMPDYQAIGKLLNVPLGHSIHDKIVPGIEKLQAENQRLRELLDNIISLQSACKSPKEIYPVLKAIIEAQEALNDK